MILTHLILPSHGFKLLPSSRVNTSWCSLASPSFHLIAFGGGGGPSQSLAADKEARPLLCD